MCAAETIYFSAVLRTFGSDWNVGQQSLQNAVKEIVVVIIACIQLAN